MIHKYSATECSYLYPKSMHLFSQFSSRLNFHDDFTPGSEWSALPCDSDSPVLNIVCFNFWCLNSSTLTHALFISIRKMETSPLATTQGRSFPFFPCLSVGLVAAVHNRVMCRLAYWIQSIVHSAGTGGLDDTRYQCRGFRTIKSLYIHTI